MLNKAVYIGGGFVHSQLLYMLPIVCSYAKEKNISCIVLDKKLPTSIMSNNQILDTIEQFNIVFVEDYTTLRYKLSREPLFLIKCTYYCILSYYLKKLKVDYNYDIVHGILDQAVNMGKDGKKRIGFFKRYISAINTLSAVYKIKELSKHHSIHTSFLGHVVYSARGLLVELRALKSKVYAQANGVIFDVSEVDSNWSFLKNSEWNLLIKRCKKEDVLNYYDNRKNGESTYYDVNIANKGRYYNSEYKNVIFLHIFRDSPFIYIDSKRIFIDYIDWLQNTLKIISKSQEKWLIKFHPNSIRWGQNNALWISYIRKELRKYGNNNVFISVDDYSNNNLFETANRIVTYSGTAHLEAACHGIKPITISMTTLESYNKDLVLKASSIQEYKKYLLCHSDDNLLKINSSEVAMAKYILYITENMLSFKNDVGHLPLYAGDDQEKFKNDFESVESLLLTNLENYRKMGYNLAGGQQRTYSQTV